MFEVNSKSSVDLGMCQPGTDKYRDELGDSSNIKELNKFMNTTYNIIPQLTFIGLGATGCINNVLKTFNSDLPVYVDKRYYVDYPGIIKDSGHEMRIFKHIWDRTLWNLQEKSIILINYPNNPTGLDIDDGEVKQLLDLSSNPNVYFIIDSVYTRLFEDNRRDWQCKLNNAIVVDSLSKTNKACGSRIGWASFYNWNEAELSRYEQKLRSVIRYSYVCPTKIKDLSKKLETVADFTKERDKLIEILEKHNIGSYTNKVHSLFVTAKISPVIQARLVAAGVNFVNHREFGSEYPEEVRLTFAVTLDELEKFDEILSSIIE